MEIVAEVTANVWKVLVIEGAEVAPGETVAILEAMKMEIPVVVEVSGVVLQVHVVEGGQVEEDQVIVTLG
jgi:acetyl-CoA carboxylase biotin carboxyl carrier protein